MSNTNLNQEQIRISKVTAVDNHLSFDEDSNIDLELVFDFLVEVNQVAEPFKPNEFLPVFEEKFGESFTPLEHLEYEPIESLIASIISECEDLTRFALNIIQA